MEHNRIMLAKERIKQLKFLKGHIQRHLKENIANTKTKSPAWQNEVVGNNITQLRKNLKKVNDKLHSDSIQKYVNNRIEVSNISPASYVDSFAMEKIIEGLEDFNIFMEISRYSYQYSIINDMYWISDGDVTDHMDIITGKKSVDYFEKFCDQKLEYLQKSVVPHFMRNKDYGEVAIMLADVCKSFGNQSFLTTNIILHSIIESVVRSFCVFLYSKQKPIKTQQEAMSYVQSFMSLETLVNKGAWGTDIPISFADALLRARYIDAEELNKAVILNEEQNILQKKISDNLAEVGNILANVTLSETDKRTEANKLIKDLEELNNGLVDRRDLTVSVSIKVELQFLLRRYKENRNSVVHGNFKNFNKKWYCYVNLSALVKIHKVIEQYQNIYPSKEEH